MDDVIDRARKWLLETESLANPSTGPSPLLPRLDAVDEGLRLRRRLDRLARDSDREALRRRVADRLLVLQSQIDRRADAFQPGNNPARGLVATRLRGWLGEIRVAVRAVSSNAAETPLSVALAFEGFRADLDWFSILISRLDQEEPHAPALLIELELTRLMRSLDDFPGTRVGTGHDQILAGRDRLRGLLLARKIEIELLIEPETPEDAWHVRLRLTRLQAQAKSLGLDTRESSTMASDWLGRLESRRTALADRVDRDLETVPSDRRAATCQALVQIVRDEVGETAAFIEDLPRRPAVARLELLKHDVDRVAQTCHRIARETHEPAARARLVRAARGARRLRARVRTEWRETLLTARLERLLGTKGARRLDSLILVMIIALCGIIVFELVLGQTRVAGLTPTEHRILGGIDLALSSVFLIEFALKLILTPDRLGFLFDHVLVDLVASLPFGFLSHQIEIDLLAAGADSRAGFSGGLATAGRWARALRFLRILLPILRLVRVALVLLRLSDRLVGRMAGLLNRNIVLFEPLQAQRPESRERHRIRAIRAELDHAAAEIEPRLDLEERACLAARLLGDLDSRAAGLEPASRVDDLDPPENREIPIEAVVERLIQMTPERLLDRAGPAFVAAANRYLRLLGLPGVRRIPWARELLVYRERSPAEAVALAANHAGQIIQRGLDLVYFLADLQGTLSPPVFLDRLGSAIVSATRTPAKRLLWLGGGFLFVYLIVRAASFLSPLRGLVDKVQVVLGWPVILLGVICLVLWAFGSWLRKIANQSADYCERVVEAQFATHTKSLKSRRREQDSRFLAERVIDPELLLRSCDDRAPTPIEPAKDEETAVESPFLFENRELAFLRNVRLLYQDYLEGSPLHRSDTKATVQLLGNLALGNLRRSNLGHWLGESRLLDRLDLSRAGGLLGGPYLWFNYITRLLVQETALLILDYNRHAIPLDRLACSPEPLRDQYRAWLASRLKIDQAEVWLPEPALGDQEGRAPATNLVDQPPRRREARLFLETVEFTAVDFMADDPMRQAEIEARFGPQVGELARRDREQNVRRAFRSFPLHDLPLSTRTINPFAIYHLHFAGGRMLLFPITLARTAGLLVFHGLAGVRALVREILQPQIDRERAIPADTYLSALRKIHRMRKPIFMSSLWLRARFDVEYVGLALPTAPEALAATALMETDLDYIRATRRDRIVAEHARRLHKKRLEWERLWLKRFGFTFEGLGEYLAAEIPYLANRGGEALRALTAACVLDHDDIATLALSIEALERVMTWAADRKNDPTKLPPDLPEPVLRLRRLWRPVHRVRRPNADLFALPCFSKVEDPARGRVLRYLRRHRRVVRGWIKVVLGQGGTDPWAVVKARMHEVLLRTDLWSDQILVLRAVQSLTMLDLQHNCELVWSLGGYEHPESDEANISPNGATARPPSSRASW